MLFPQFKWVVFVALKQEVPSLFQESEKLCVISYKSIESGDYRVLKTSNASILCIITGVGKMGSESSAEWVLEHCDVLHGLNIGSAGAIKDSSLVGSLVLPLSVSHIDSEESIEVWDTVGFYTELSLKRVDSCVTVLDKCDSLSNDIIDMESFYIANVFKKRGVPFSVCKFITDSNDDNTDQDFQRSLGLMQDTFNKLFEECLSINIDSISVVIPSFNRVNMLKRAVDSVLSQTYPCELIIIDDGSADDTQAYLDSLPSSIRHYRFETNQGVSVARNKGLALATHDWICFLDSDDEWVPTKVERQRNYILMNPFFSVIQSQEIWMRDGVKRHQKSYQKKREGFIFESCMKRCMVTPSSLMIKTSFLKKYGGFDVDYVCCEDYALWLRLSRYYLIGCDSYPSLIKYAGHDDQLSFKYSAMDRFRCQALADMSRQETQPLLKKTLNEELSKKLMILKNGAIKRGQTEDVQLYNQFLIEFSNTF